MKLQARDDSFGPLLPHEQLMLILLNFHFADILKDLKLKDLQVVYFVTQEN